MVRLSRSALLVIGISIYGISNAQLPYSPTQSITLAGPVPSIDAVGSPSNFRTMGFTVSQSYALGPVVKVLNCTVTKVAAQTYATDARFKMTNSSTPGLSIDFSPFSNGSYAIDLTVSGIEKYITSPMVGATIAAGSTWTIESYESFQDGPAGMTEQVLSNVNLQLTGTPFTTVVQNFSVPGPVNSIDNHNDPSNTRVVLGTSTSSYHLDEAIMLNSASVTLQVQGTFAREAAVRLRNSAFPFSFADFSPATIEGYTGTHVVPAGPRPLVGPLVGAQIPAGSAWTAEFFETVDDGPANISEQTVSNLSFGIGSGPALIPATPPPSVIDLGTITAESGLVVRNSGPIAPGQVVWFKFKVLKTDGATGAYLDINTAQVSTLSDTDIALYSANGAIIEQDDDDGAGYLSMLTFGDFSSPRPAPGALSLPFDGRDGDGLDAGTYYLAASSFNNYYYPGFVVTNNNITSFTAGFNVEIRTNVAAPQNVMAGTVDLEAIPDAGETIDFYLRDPDGVETLLMSAQIQDPSTFSISTSQTGTYKLVARKDGFLSDSSTQFSLGGSGYPAFSFNLKNGDVDRDGEIGPSDFDAVVSQFGLSTGFDPAVDLDRDGEVGPSDFDLVVANFGLTDQ